MRDTDESAAADIRGIIIGMSNHIITKSKMIVDGYVDAAAIGRRLFILPGEVFSVYLNEEEVSRGHSSCGNEPCL